MRRIPIGTGNPDLAARAAEALDLARKMKPGLERSAALKEASRLQTAASGYVNSKGLKPPKQH
jgi:hypothetical protein